MLIPAIVVSKICSKSPSNLLTSVDVPPISKPIIGVRVPGSNDVSAYPTSPPA